MHTNTNHHHHHHHTITTTPGVSAMNHFYGHDNVTLGAWKGKYGSDCNQHYEGTSGQNQYVCAVYVRIVCSVCARARVSECVVDHQYRVIRISTAGSQYHQYTQVILFEPYYSP